MKMTDLLSKELCEPGLRARNKADVLREMSTVLKRHPALRDVGEDAILDKLMAREELGSTGFGGGLAIPHCRLPGLDRFILALGVSKRGVAFDAMDGKKAHLFCVMVGPDNEPQRHVKMLAEISLAVKTEAARREMIKAPSQIALYESFLRHSLRDEDTNSHRKKKLLMLVLQDEDTVTDVMELFVEMGIRGASVLESQAMGKVLTTVPLFASFINFLGSEDEYQRIIFSIVHEDQVARVIDSIEEITGDMDTHTGAMALVLDIAMMKGSLQSF
ncbi:MAG: PTS sugar transporter subunit IIA [Spartobacteria bacterium]|nr:PTS sugar transporter subunit IIA [Spartobacteria bacterium]